MHHPPRRKLCATPRMETMLLLFSGLLILSGCVLALVGVFSKTKSGAEKLTATFDSGFLLFYLALLLSGDPKILLSLVLMGSGTVLLGLVVY